MQSAESASHTAHGVKDASHVPRVPLYPVELFTSYLKEEGPLAAGRELRTAPGILTAEYKSVRRLADTNVWSDTTPPQLRVVA